MSAALRIMATDSGTLGAPLDEELMGRPLTRDELLDAKAEGWGLRETAKHYGTTVHQVRAAEARERVSLGREAGPGVQVRIPDLEGLYASMAAGETLEELAADLEVAKTTLYQRLMFWAAEHGKPWPPPRGPSSGELLHRGRLRTATASQRMGLLGGRAMAAASWTTVMEETGVVVDSDVHRTRELLAAKYAKRWALSAGEPHGRALVPPRWNSEEREDRARSLREAIVASFGPEVVGLLDEVAGAALVLLEVYAATGALEVLETKTAEPERPYHRYRAEAAAFVRALAAQRGIALKAVRTDLERALSGRPIGEAPTSGGADGAS